MLRIAVVLATITVVGCAAQLTLSELIIPPEVLTDCHLTPIPPGTETPCGVPSNPFLASSREQLDCLGGMLLAPHQHQHHHHDGGSDSPTTDASTAELLSSLDGFLFSVYGGGGEAGIFALRFIDSESAERAAKIIRSQTPQAKVIVKNKIVTDVWHDQGGDRCSSELWSLVSKRLD